MAIPSKALAIDVSRDPSAQRQRFESWGTSLAWWANAVGGWSDSDARADLVHTMFDQENGLGLNYARYNVGGGQNRQLGGNFRPGALVNGWVPSAPTSVSDTSTWDWNWDADATQRRVLQEVLDLGVSRVDAISYSAPYWMTNSQDSAGGVGGAPNLPPAHYDELAHYQASVVEHFHDNLGVRFQAFSPLNEPDVNWWVAGGGQEGMAVPDGQPQRDVLHAVAQEFTARGLPVGLSALEETNTGKTVNSWQQLDAASKASITHLHTHTYGGNSTSNLNTVRNLAAADGVKLYMSEYGNNSTTGLQGGVALANRITQDINEMGVNGWAYWQVVEPVSLSGAGWGLAWAGYSAGDSGHTIQKQFHVMRQFTHAIRPDSTILETDDSNTVAAYDSAANVTTLVVSNLSESADQRTYNLTDGGSAFVRTLRTSNGEDFASIGAKVSGPMLTVDAPGPSVTTLVVHHQPNLIGNPFLDNSGASQAIAGGWQADGAGEYLPGFGPDGQDPGVGKIAATLSAGGGRLWQSGIGDGTTELTGEAFQLSLDVRFKEQSLQKFNADATLSLEFYGADGETLVQTDPEQFTTPLQSLTDDTQWRTFRTPVTSAPAGARFVRPVVEVADAQFDSSSDLYVDNFYLQTIRPIPRGRKWVASGVGSTNVDANWEFDADRSRHGSWYFASESGQPVIVAVDGTEAIDRLTIDSSDSHRLGGSGVLRLEATESETPMLDVRSGVHRLQTEIQLEADTVVQAVGDAQLTMSGPILGAGHDLLIQGAGVVVLDGPLTLQGGDLVVDAEPESSVVWGESATLDGALRVLLAPGIDPVIGDQFELLAYAGAPYVFASIDLPALEAGLDWELAYGDTDLTASVTASALAGDYNGDGVVDAADYTVWRDGLGEEYTPGDYAVWADGYGDGAPSSILQVPEPSACSLMTLVGLLVLARPLHHDPHHKPETSHRERDRL